ncbi:MAG: helix-turn-helix domain-containing protein [Atopobiaceae bacterium]
MLSYTMDVEKRSTWLRATPTAEQRQQGFYCTEAGAFYARSHFSTERSHKDAFIVFYTLGGEGLIQQGDTEVRLMRGQGLIMDCRTPQRYGTSPSRHHWYHLWTHVDGAGVRALADRMGLMKPISLPLADVRPAFDNIFADLAVESPLRDVRIGFAVHMLLAAMTLAGAQAIPTGDSSAVQLAQSFVEAHYAEPISVDDMAHEAGLSTSQLSRLFRQQLKTTPHSYLTRYRITRAKELLAETTMPIATIARQTGFASASNFSYRFGQEVGQSPNAYRSSVPHLFGDS